MCAVLTQNHALTRLVLLKRGRACFGGVCSVLVVVMSMLVVSVGILSSKLLYALKQASALKLAP